MLADVMSNFRPCRRQWFAGIACEDTPLFTPADAELIFNASADTRYELAMRKIGIDPAMLSMEAGHA